MNKRLIGLPEKYLQSLTARLVDLDYPLSKPRKIAEAVLRLSDFYVHEPFASTPWKETWVQAASLAYYFPLNYARNLAVANEASRLGFFADLGFVCDFGSGLGSGHFALADALSDQAKSLKILASDVSSVALEISNQLTPDSNPKFAIEAISGFVRPNAVKPENAKSGVILASYVLTELQSMPDWWHDFEALVIVEPSTSEDARKLMTERQKLIDGGWHIWGPCTHHGRCPLLEHSARDWCHDRIHWQAPKWFTEIEKHLPMKNRTLTFSYLLARKTKPPPDSLKSLARLTGDMLEEKGKTRMSVCRGPEREFLAWFPQRMPKTEKMHFERGSLVTLQPELAKKSSEIRVSAKNQVEEIPPHQSIE